MNSAWPRDRNLVRSLFSLTAIVIAGLVYTNLSDPKLGFDFLAVVVPARLLQIASYLMIVYLSFRSDRPDFYPYVIAFSQVSTLLAESLNNYLAVLPVALGDRPPVPFIIIILFAYYTLVPARFSYTIAYGVLTTLIYSYMASLYFPVIGYMLLMFVFVNLIGISYGRHTNRLKRQEYVTNKALEVESAQRRVAEAEALEAKKIAESASAEKSRFIAVASHDLRQPLHAMGMWIDTLSDQLGKVGPDVLEDTVAHMTTAKNNLDGLLDRLLHASHLEKDTTVVRRESLPVEDIVHRLNDRFFVEANQKGVRLRVRSQSLHVESDAILLDRILDNLTDNAIKYTDAGGQILIGVRRGKSSVHFQVWNTGEQIPQSQHEKIFEEFHQASSSGRGLGLGLSIVRRLSEILGHEVRVANVGSCLTMFELTVHASTDEPIATVPVERHAVSRYEVSNVIVLVLDDDVEVRSAMQSMLTRWGFEVMLAANRHDAERAIGKKLPEIIIADQHLQQQESGILVAKELLEKFDLDIPVLLLSGETAPTSIKAAKASGFKHMVKPVKPAVLRMEITQLLENSRARR